MQQKEGAWLQLTEEFNALVDVARDSKALKVLYDNIKRAAKKSSADEKVARKKTGGGVCEVVVDETTQKVLGLLGNRATPLVNLYDGDAEYNGDLLFASLVSNEPVADVNTSVNNSVNNSVNFLFPQSERSDSATGFEPSASTSSVVKSIDPVAREARQWAGKRRPRPRISDQRTQATSSISQLAQHEIAYYEEKLEMERREHCMRMDVLEMKKELLALKIKTLREQ